MSFKEAFENIPACLKDIFIKRFIFSAISLVIGIVVWLVVGFALSFPFLAIFLFFLVTGMGMLYYCIGGNYVVVKGYCKNIELSPLKEKIKSIYIVAENGADVIKIPPKDGAKKLNKGDAVVLYIPAKAVTVKRDGVFELQEYYCLELTPKIEENTD